MRKSISVFLVFFGLLFSTVVSAADPFFIQGDVQVPSACEVTDTSGKTHIFPKASSPSGLLGICAIVAAKGAGVIESFTFIDFGFGLFLDSINGVNTSADWDKSWSLYHNGELASVGLADLVIENFDTVSLIYTSFSSGQEFDKLILKVVSPASVAATGKNSHLAASNMDVAAAVQFLEKNQAESGVIGNLMFTDWVAVAFGAAAGSSYEAGEETITLLKSYLLNNTEPGASLGPPVLSFLRRAMALMALRVNPYSGTDVNYIQKIVEAFDEEQIGEKNLVNDDIFALLVLLKAGFDSQEDIISKTTRFILSQQRSDGAFAGGVDMTASAIQALVLVADAPGVSETIAKAKTYLQSKQESDGGFGNLDSTSWVMQAIAALGEDWREWKKDGKTPGEYMLLLQKQDGSLDSPNPVWSTAYAVPATLGKPWGMILGSFSKQEPNYPKELERISQELAQIKKQALALEIKVTRLALAESEAQAIARAEEDRQFSERKEELVSQAISVLPSSGNTGSLGRFLSAQVRAVASRVLLVAVAGAAVALVAVFLLPKFLPNFFTKLWKSPANKQEVDRLFVQEIK